MRRRWRWVRYLLLLLFLLLAGYAFSPYVQDIVSLYEVRKGLAYRWMLFGAVVQLAQYGGEGYFTARLLSLIGFQVRVKDAVRIATLEVFATHVLPLGQLGMLAANLYFYHRLGVNTQALFLFNVALGLGTVFVLLALFLISVLIVPRSVLPAALHLSILVTTALLVVIVLAAASTAIRSRTVRSLLVHWLRRAPGYRRLRRWVLRLRRSRSLITDRRWAFLALVLGKDVVYYLGDIITLQSCFLAFHAFPAVPVVLFAYVLALGAGAITLIPGGVGPTDITLGVVLLTTGISPAVVIGAVLLYRFLSLILPIPLGAFSYYWLRRDLGPARTPPGFQPTVR